MKGCLNILWHFPFFGFLFAFFYALFGAILCCTVILYPVGLGYFQIAQFLLSPFTSALVTRKDLDLVRPKERSTAAMAYSTIIMVLYFPVGLIAAAGAVFVIAGEFLSIIGIPCGMVWFKALRAIFSPIDMICVPKAVGDEIERIKAGDTVAKFKGEGNTYSDAKVAQAGEREVIAEEFGEVQLPPRPEVREYDDAKLGEIVSNAALYRASLVEECRREQELRHKSEALMPVAKGYDDGKLREVLKNPHLYADELIYACTLEQTERRRIWHEEQEKQKEQARVEREAKAEQQRLEREKAAKEARARNAAAWKKWRPVVLTTIAVLILGAAGAGYYLHRQKQEELRLEELASAERLATYEKRKEENRIAEQKREAERQEERRAAAETQAEQRRIAAQKQAEEQRLAAEEQKRLEEEQRIAAEKQAEEEKIRAIEKQAAGERAAKAYQLAEAQRKQQLAKARQETLANYKEGDLYQDIGGKGVIIKHGTQGALVLTFNRYFGSWPGIYPAGVPTGWRLPTRAELSYIQSNRDRINKYLAAVGGDQIRSGVYYWSSSTGYRENERIASNGMEISRDKSNKNHICLVFEF